MKQKTHKATLYKIDGSKEPLILEEKTRLNTLQKLVDGYIEIIHINGNDVILNEEGRLINLPINPSSYEIGANSPWKDEIFYGNIIVVEGRLP